MKLTNEIIKNMLTTADEDFESNSQNMSGGIYGITYADYTDYDESVPLIDRVLSETYKFQKQLAEYIEDEDMHFKNELKNKYPSDMLEAFSTLPIMQSKHYVIKPYQLLILWKNAPTDVFLEDMTDQLIIKFCQMIANEEESIKKLYIFSSDTLAMGDINNLYRRLYIIDKFFGHRPLFMVKDIIEEISSYEVAQSGISFSDTDNTETGLDMSTQIMNDFSKRLFGTDRESRTNNILYRYSLRMFENILKKNDMIPDFESLNNNFISLYFKWQFGDNDINIVKFSEELGSTKGKTKPLSRSSFYRLIEFMEKNPVYAEYLKLYAHSSEDFCNTARKGRLDIDIDAFLSDYSSLVKSDSDIIGKYHVCQKYNIVSLEDLNRYYLQITKKAKSPTRKKS